MKWNKITSRPVDKKEPHLGVVMDGEFPDIDEKVIVYTKSGGVYTDFWIDYSSGVGFENTFETEHSTIYWMPFPEPPKEED